MAGDIYFGSKLTAGMGISDQDPNPDFRPDKLNLSNEFRNSLFVVFPQKM